ncbi:MAG: RNA polymerase factor sigma-32 [Magnetococcales bacterium]|nr:RNA polymerase factor sigma-32 [Magnetococcales bacterium]
MIVDVSELTHYMSKIHHFPVLSSQEEFRLAVLNFEQHDLQAAHQLVSSYLRYVVKIAKQYAGYGMRLMDLVQEGSLGLIRAVSKFNPHMGFRLATYAIWWIRMAIQDFILQSWSLVKIGTTAMQRKLFFSLRKNKLSIGQMNYDEACILSQKLGAKAQEIINMDARLINRDNSLNYSSVDNGMELQDLIPDIRNNQEVELLNSEARHLRRQVAAQAMRALNARERIIISWRILRDCPLTLKEISGKLGVSRERIRQLENQALEKMRQTLRSASSLSYCSE